MTWRKGFALATAFLMLGFAAPTAAEPYQDAWTKAFEALKSEDYPTAALLFRAMAEQGYAGAQFQLGFIYRMGWGVPQDYEEALKWLRRAADQGHNFAQSNLGFMYRDGEGVPKDYVQAHMWFNLSAASRGLKYETAAEQRDRLAEKMTPAQIAEAQKLAREWKPTKERIR